MEHLVPVLVLSFHVYIVVTLVLLLLDNREPSSTLAWVMVFVLLPVIGVIIYILFGRNWKRLDKKKMFAKQFLEKKLADVLAPLINWQSEEVKKLESQTDLFHRKKLFHLLSKSSHAILTTTNKIKILQNGAEKFPALKEDLKNAKDFIHMEYFIWRVDPLTQEIKQILLEKAAQGVEVRVLYDALGSIFMKKSYVQELRAGGVEIYPYFNFLSSWKIHTLNYRNHRKIVIIDGKIAYTGGMNMGQEYIDGGRQFDYWRDTHLRVEGETVALLQGIFTVSWFNTTKTELFDPKYYPRVMHEDKKLPVQVSTSGPDSQWPSIKQLYFRLITLAEKKVYIQSPYFIPDPSVHAALKSAALGGLDVRIIIAGVADKNLPYWSAFTYFKDLLQAGVRIYHYKKGFMHAKTIIIDSDVCSVGTANMDVRSFHLNYELNLLIYDAPSAMRLEEDFKNDLKDSREFTLSDYGKLGEEVKLRNSLARLLTPLL